MVAPYGHWERCLAFRKMLGLEVRLAGSSRLRSSDFGVHQPASVGLLRTGHAGIPRQVSRRQSDPRLAQHPRESIAGYL